MAVIGIIVALIGAAVGTVVGLVGGLVESSWGYWERRSSCLPIFSRWS